jgi:uncharacterized RDD family membrane protein YckC
MTAVPRRDRLEASVIDLLPFFGVVVLVGFVAPSVTQTTAFIIGSRMVFGAYLLLRDLAGGSAGKRARKLRVVNADGQPAEGTQLFLRNTTIAAVPFCADVPIAAPLSLVLLAGEIVMLLVRGHRLGDMLAGTSVVRLPPAAAAPASPSADVPSAD